ncbi:MAG: type IX secretion system membrane protein PorP/SprF [Sphingobacteriaceae bacterium]|nr:MAG: type IX secretion system membrane protein PorP/SprF [Sphingobacteriaceae bacterium]
MKNSTIYKSGLLFSACLTLIMLSCTNTYAQVDLQGSQYIFNKTYINPAFAGTEGTLNANLFYQMNNSNGGATANSGTAACAIDGLFPNNKSAYGFNFVRNRFGNDSYTVANANYAYHLDLSQDLTLSSGVGLGFQQFNIDLLNLQTVTANDPVSSNNVYSSKADAHAGLRMLYKSKYYAGLSFDNLLSVYTTRNDYENNVPQMFRKISMYAIAGANVDFPSSVNLKSSLLLMKTFGGLTAIEFSAMFEMMHSLSLGASFRQNISYFTTNTASRDYLYQSILRPMIQYNISRKNNLRVGYCYSFNAGTTNNLNRGSNDFSIVYNIPGKSNFQ